MLVSTFCLRMEVRGREELAFRIEHGSLAILPILFYALVAWAIVWATH